jgi:hypothetical protein
MYAARDSQKNRLIEKFGMRRAEVFERFPAELSKVYAKYGVEDDLLGVFDEDELPDSGALLPSDEDDTDELEDLSEFGGEDGEES